MVTELPTWKTLNLKKWREANGFTTPEWEAYVKAVNIKDLIFTLTYLVLGIAIGLGIGSAI